jgi:hypothetical protein
MDSLFQVASTTQVQDFYIILVENHGSVVLIAYLSAWSWHVWHAQHISYNLRINRLDVPQLPPVMLILRKLANYTSSVTTQFEFHVPTVQMATAGLTVQYYSDIFGYLSALVLLSSEKKMTIIQKKQKNDQQQKEEMMNCIESVVHSNKQRYTSLDKRKHTNDRKNY